MSTLTWRILTEDEQAQQEAAWRQWSLEQAWRLWRLYSCTERGGHFWYLDITPEDGAYLACTGCGADEDDLISPDGADLLTGEFEVYPGYTLSLDGRDVLVNGRRTGDGLLAYGWRGPVTATVRVETYRCEYGTEYDIFIDLEAL